MGVNKNIMLMRSLADDWTLYASSTFTTDSPAAAVQNKRPGVRGRSTDTTSGSPAYVRFDGGSTGALSAGTYFAWFGYISHDGTAGTLLGRIRLSTVSDFASTVYDSGSGGHLFGEPWAGRDYAHGFIDTTGQGPTAARYLELSVWATGASHIDIGRLMVGVPWQPSRNARLAGFVQPTPRERVGIQSGSRGQQFDIPGQVYLEASGRLIFTDESEMRGTFSELINTVGRSGNILYCSDPLDYTYLQQRYVSGRFVDLSPLTQIDDEIWSFSFKVQEFH